MRIEPFKALRYAPPVAADLARLIAPPYDVISPEHRARLAAHPRNIVHVDLPAASGERNPYEAAARTLESWKREGILVRDPAPAFYVCEQEFRSASGALMRRRGVFARLGLEPLDGGVVLPHERTLDSPRADRLRLLESTRTHVSPVFMLHPDPRAEVSALLARLAQAAPTGAFTDDEGVGVRLWAAPAADGAGKITALLRDAWGLIADGHHRYESAWEFHSRRETKEPGWILAYLCSLEDPGLGILPIHRAIHSVPDFDPEKVREGMRAWFDLVRLPSAAALPPEIASRRAQPGVFGLVFGEEPSAWLGIWREGAGLDRPGMRSVPSPLRRLDVILLHRLLLEDVLGISQEAQARQDHVRYVKDSSSILNNPHGMQLAVLLNPTRIDQVIDVSREGLRLPQKSTYFHPKVPTGLVLDPISG